MSLQQIRISYYEWTFQTLVMEINQLNKVYTWIYLVNTNNQAHTCCTLQASRTACNKFAYVILVYCKYDKSILYSKCTSIVYTIDYKKWSKLNKYNKYCINNIYNSLYSKDAKYSIYISIFCKYSKYSINNKFINYSKYSKYLTN